VLSSVGEGARVRGFLISGKNASDQPLSGVEGILKPDMNHRDSELILSVDGNQLSNGNVRTIPPGAQFSLVYEFPKRSNGMPMNFFLAKFGGAIFTFRYTYAGKQRVLITYFSASMIKAQPAERGS